MPLKWKFQQKVLFLHGFYFLWYLQCLSFDVPRFRPLGFARKFAEYKWKYRVRSFNVLEKLVRLPIYSYRRVFSLPGWYFSLLVGWKDSEKLVLRVAVIIFSWFGLSLSLIEGNLRNWILSKKSSCIIR